MYRSALIDSRGTLMFVAEAETLVDFLHADDAKLFSAEDEALDAAIRALKAMQMEPQHRRNYTAIPAAK
jgi:hypothetical protein